MPDCALRRWPCEIPIDGSPKDVHDAVSAYSRWLGQSDIPMILFYGHPGGLIREDGVAWCRNTIANLEAVDIGAGIHFVQEDNPHFIGKELSR